MEKKNLNSLCEIHEATFPMISSFNEGERKKNKEEKKKTFKAFKK